MFNPVSSRPKGPSVASRPDRTGEKGRGESVVVSTIIPTVGGRESLLDAIHSVLNQQSSTFEKDIVVVNDSGGTLPDAAALDAIDSVRVVRTGRRRAGAAVARNTGAFVARGEFLHFLDDDDRMMDGAFEAFADVLELHPDAQWIYGITERWSRDGDYIDTLPTELEGNVLAALFCGEWLPLQASLVRARLFREVGGFDVALAASEDMDLLLRMGEVADVVRVRQPVCRYHFDTTQSVARRSLDGPTLYDAYEKAMDHPHTQRRIRASAKTPHMYGKAVRKYLISLKRHLRQRTIGKLLSRTVDAALMLGGGGRFLIHPSLWRAVFSRASGMTEAGEDSSDVRHAAT